MRLSTLLDSKLVCTGGTGAPGGVEDVEPSTGFHATRNRSHGNLTGARRADHGRWQTFAELSNSLCNSPCKLMCTNGLKAFSNSIIPDLKLLGGFTSQLDGSRGRPGLAWQSQLGEVSVGLFVWTLPGISCAIFEVGMASPKLRRPW